MPGTIKMEWYLNALNNGTAEEVEQWFQGVANKTELEISQATQDDGNTIELFVWDGTKWLEQEDIDRYCALIDGEEV